MNRIKITAVLLIIVLFFSLTLDARGAGGAKQKPGLGTVPLYRLQSDQDQNHFYTIDTNEKDHYVSNKGYRFEKISGRVYTTKKPGTIPLHRLYNPTEKNHFYTIRDNYMKLVNRSYKPYRYQGIVGYVYAEPKGNAIPLYRLRNNSKEDHFYTTSEIERDDIQKKGYRFERIECYIEPRLTPAGNSAKSGKGISQDQNTAPLYRLRNDEAKNHFYTAKKSIKDTYEKRGYRFESIVGRIYKKKKPGTVPLHQLYNPSERNHFYTIRDNYMQLVNRSYNPYKYQGIIGYVYPERKENSLPLYRLRNNSQKNHFYTTNQGERDNAQKKGYRYESIECYILPAHRPTVHEKQKAEIVKQRMVNPQKKEDSVPTQVEFSGNFVEDEDVRIWQAHGGAIILFDFDNDNDLDIVLNGKVRADLYKNDGTGNYEWLKDNLESMDYCDAAVGDMDGDNYQDIIFAGRGETILYSNNKDGTFSETTREFIGLHSTALVTGDIDGDSDLDFIVCGRDGSLNKEAHLYFNKGNNKFEESNQDFKGVAKGSVQLADMDGDNDLDILLTGNKSTFIYLNNGKGKFTEKSNSIGKYYASDSDLADIDNDGDMDIVMMGDTDNDETSKIYLNDGNANFTDSGENLVGLDKGCAEFIDIDLDGAPDLFLSGWDGDNGKTTLYINDGSGSFTETEISLPGGRQSMVDFGDVDGDGDIDIVFGAYRGGTALYRQK